ncbi:uncharacterized protein MAM_08337 [Metarhizium album ARSEF 1941]|uniref:Translation machinery-associated protein 16 n=1 Tax=Metarhizium album (strain ARSEF 1941) TaxID=1081103 RepID=A0A0B2WLC2_METAS|nr:uncharacterized protein MAM_08337 [Metarhizium album ARSEF 1941]KHN93810.1 hypothetical protein MAM_08337 [Metarhizium album ARSEF 1941]
MPSSLQKTRKHIAKKRNGEVNALHAKSRDSLRLHKAGVRDQRLEKLAAARSKKEQPIGTVSIPQRNFDRVSFFQESLDEKDPQPLDVETVQSYIKRFIRQYDEEYDGLKKARRPGRPASAREDLLKLKIAALEKEYRNGFVIPDVMTANHAKSLQDWEGSWAYLTTLPWIKVSSAGQVRSAEFPSKGIN